MDSNKEADKFYQPDKSVTPSAAEKYKISPKSDADLFYGEGAVRKGGIYDSATKEGLERMSDNLGLTNSQLEESRASSAKLFYELNVSPADAQRIHSVFTQHLIEPPDSDKIKAWEVEARGRLRTEYGEKAEGLLKKTREFVARAGMADALEKSGVGSHPDTVMSLVDHVARLARR